MSTGVINARQTSLTRGNGAVTVNANGSVTIAPAAGSPDGTMGVSLSTPDLLTYGTVTTPLLKVTVGNYQQGIGGWFQQKDFCKPALGVGWDTYSTAVPRSYWDVGAYFSQAWVELSGDQNMTTGVITYGSHLDAMLGLNTDVRNGILIRINTTVYTTTTTTSYAIKSGGLSSDPTTGTWTFAQRGDGMFLWGSIAATVQPYTLNTAMFGYNAATGYMEALGAGRWTNHNANAYAFEVRMHASQIAGPALALSNSSGVVQTAILQTGELLFQDANSAYGVVGLPAWDRTFFAFQNRALAISAANVALWQASNGTTAVNCASGQSVYLRVANATKIQINGTGIGFNGSTPIAKPTGVAVSAAAIHQVLSDYGLLAA